MFVLSVLFLGGLAIYAGYGLPGLAYLAAACAVTYGAGLLIPKHRWVMPAAVILNAAMLVAQKVQGIFGVQLFAVMGLSYFTLQIIAYLVDVSRGKYEPERNFLLLSLHLTFLPHIFIGPIEGYPAMRQTLLSRRFSWDGISEGAIRAVWGLFKKFVIAARAGVIVSFISADPEQYSGAFALLAMLMYSVQLYADFSGGIDMVLGVSRMLGITMSENFDAPYFSQSVQEFWRRWHITLGAWLRQYVYIPLGGNRKGKLRKLLNTLITFTVSGLWHGTGYVLWGLLNGIFVSVGEKCRTPWKLLNQLGTFLLITLSWAFFVWPSTAVAVKMLASVFSVFNWGLLVTTLPQMGLVISDWLVLGAAVAVLWLVDAGKSGLRRRIDAFSPAARTALVCALGLIVLVFGMYGIGFNASEFIYSRF